MTTFSSRKAVILGPKNNVPSTLLFVVWNCNDRSIPGAIWFTIVLSRIKLPIFTWYWFGIGQMRTEGLVTCNDCGAAAPTVQTGLPSGKATTLANCWRRYMMVKHLRFFMVEWSHNSIRDCSRLLFHSIREYVIQHGLVVRWDGRHYRYPKMHKEITTKNFSSGAIRNVPVFPIELFHLIGRRKEDCSMANTNYLCW